jgi:5-methylcytosine-specific restriction protein A
MSLERKTPMQRGGELRRTAMKRSRATRTRPRDTGPTKTTRDIVWERAGGRCELCGGSLAGIQGFSRHHRLPRRMGGSSRPELNTPANLLLVCGSGTTGCHGRIESRRAQAYEDGLLLHEGADPAVEPVILANPSVSAWPQTVWLTLDGCYSTERPAPTDGDPDE